ncbi:hypothetical protein niasHT_014786 [Heterodera trifolii]|uniref:Uncharacterized protein n=1 Tax=Heterodera trifolii TaxID=157864 RepID=A0ABD2L6Q3_9BILA
MWVLGHHWITYQAGAQGHQLAYELVEPSWTTLPTFSVLWNSMVGMCQCSLGNHGPGVPFCYGGAPHRGTTVLHLWFSICHYAAYGFPGPSRFRVWTIQLKRVMLN